MFYAMAFLLIGSSGGPVDLSEKAPRFQDFHRRLWAGEIDLAGNPMKVVYGRIHWVQFLANTRKARFGEALRIVSERRE